MYGIENRLDGFDLDSSAEPDDKRAKLGLIDVRSIPVIHK